MTIRAYDLIASICSEFKEIGGNNLQAIYEIASIKDAKLVYDVLIAYGFNTKVYQTPEKTAKLYVAHVTTELPNLDHAMTYANALNNIKHELDALPSQTYTMHFTNSPPSGKQIMIQIAEPSSQSKPVAFAATNSTHAVTTSKPLPQAKRRGRDIPQEDTIATGPAVAKASYTRILGAEGDRPDTFRKRAVLYLTGNMATSSFAFLMMVVGLAIIFSFFVFAKAFICPDFASMKRNHSWYCAMFVQQDDDDKKQP